MTDNLFGPDQSGYNPDLFIQKLKSIERYRVLIDAVNLKADQLGVEIDHNVAKMIDFVIEFESWSEQDQIDYLRKMFPQTDNERRLFEEGVSEMGVYGALTFFKDTLVKRILELEEERLGQSVALAKIQRRISNIGEEVRGIMFERN